VHLQTLEHALEFQTRCAGSILHAHRCSRNKLFRHPTAQTAIRGNAEKLRAKQPKVHGTGLRIARHHLVDRRARLFQQRFRLALRRQPGLQISRAGSRS
jgi:hypothetical protein